MNVVHRWWFDDVLLLVLFGGPIALAALMHPTHEVVSLFGWDVPTLCASRLVWGRECLGCGMTRGFSFLAHGDLADAWAVNKLAPAVFVLFASQVPYRLIRLVRQGLERRAAARRA